MSTRVAKIGSLFARPWPTLIACGPISATKFGPDPGMSGQFRPDLARFGKHVAASCLHAGGCMGLGGVTNLHAEAALQLRDALRDHRLPADFLLRGRLGQLRRQQRHSLDEFPEVGLATHALMYNPVPTHSCTDVYLQTSLPSGVVFAHVYVQVQECRFMCMHKYAVVCMSMYMFV